jgi:hypothetical protein
MADYVKICPKASGGCGKINPETEYKCLQCGYFLGDVDPVSEADTSITEQAAAEETPRTSDTDAAPGQEESAHTQQGSGQGTTDRFLPPMLSIEYSGNRYPVQSGMIMGRADATSTAELQIPGLPSYIHRRHCRFEYGDRQWQVAALDNGKDTNAMFINGTILLPNQSRLLLDGDRLTLCDIHFSVRIVS